MDTTARATCWSVTINNPTASDDDAIARARQMGWIVSGQKEQGASETPHYQLMVKTPQVRFSSVKRMFPRAHIEVARDKHALEKYVHKDQGRLGELPESKKYPTMGEFWMLVYHHWSRVDKDCLNQDELWEHSRVRFYREMDDRAFDNDPLPWLDEAARRYIRDGFYVETLATNPAVRSAWKKFGREILERCHNSNRREMEHENNTQTDRQTDTVEIPVASEINADESSPSQATQGLLEGVLRETPSRPSSAEDQEGRDEDREECDRSESGE